MIDLIIILILLILIVFYLILYFPLVADRLLRWMSKRSGIFIQLPLGLFVGYTLGKVLHQKINALPPESASLFKTVATVIGIVLTLKFFIFLGNGQDHEDS